jgi:hypothetical protein
MSDTNNKRHITPLELFASIFTLFFLAMMFMYFLFM